MSICHCNLCAPQPKDFNWAPPDIVTYVPRTEPTIPNASHIYDRPQYEYRSGRLAITIQVPKMEPIEDEL